MSNENSSSSGILSSPEIRRFQHQINLPQIGLEGQERIKAAKVIVIGAGGIGAQVLQFLAASGIGSLTIVDDEIVSERNIQLQTLYGGNDLGKLKTIISRQQLQNLYPLTSVEILNLRITSENAQRFLGGCDIIVDATNHPDSSFVINDACLKLNKSWIYGFTSGFSGEVTVFNYRGGPSYRCLFPEQVSGNERKDVPAFVSGTVGCLMANECIKLILQSTDTLSGKILNLDLYSNIFVQQPFYRMDENFK